MNLKNIQCQYLSPSDIVLLNQSNIYTAEQLVTHTDLDQLSLKCCIHISKLKQIKKHVIGQYAPLPELGTEIASKSIKRLFSLTFGYRPIDDELLAQGVFSNEIVEICGASSTAKSELCLNLIANTVAINSNFKCLYVDSSRNFCTKRFAALLKSKIDSSANNNDDKFKRAASSSSLIKCRNLFQLLHTLYQLEKPISLNPNHQSALNKSTNSPNLLVIDNLSVMLEPFKFSDKFELNFYLNCLFGRLKHLKSEFNMAIVLVTSNHRMYELSQLSSVHYDTWKCLSNVIIRLRKFDCLDNHESSARVYLFELLKCNRSLLSTNKKHCLFKINDTGLIGFSDA